MEGIFALAHMGSKCTDGRIAFVKYVVDNADWTHNPTYTICSSRAGHGLVVGDVVTLQSSEMFDVGGKTYCRVSTHKLESDVLIPISALKKPKLYNPTIHEDVVVANINAAIDSNDLPISIGGQLLGRVTTARRIDRGCPKADIVLYDGDTPVCFLSHKKRGGARAFHHYGGVSAASGAQIANHPEVEAFLNNLWTGHTGHRVIEDDVLICRAVFGSEYGGDRGLNNVDFLCQGDVVTKIVDGVLVLEFSDHLIKNGDIGKLCGDYRPVLFARRATGRSVMTPSGKVLNTRVVISPLAIAEGRSVIADIKRSQQAS